MSCLTLFDISNICFVIHQDKSKFQGSINSNFASRRATKVMKKVNSSESNFLHNQHNPNLVGGLDVPPDSDGCGDQMQSIKNLGATKNPWEAIKVVKQ